MIKICLDAGHYGKYNQSPCDKAYYESDMVWKLHLLLKKYLESYGINVITTREVQEKNLALYNRGAKSKGCDLFISLHSNAVGSDINETIDYPVAYAAVNGSADRIATLLTECVEDIMDLEDQARIEHRRGNNGDYYGVVRGATAVGTPGLILEHSFHTHSKSTKWLLNNEKLDKLARAEAAVIAGYFGIASGSTGEATSVQPMNGYVTVIYNGSDGLNLRTAPCIGDNVAQVVFSGTYTVTGISDDGKWYQLKNGLYVKASKKYVEYSETAPQYMVRVAIDDLNIRERPDASSDSHGHTGVGSFTIVDEDNGWGLLKSYARERNGWIKLSYTERI